MTPSEQQIVEWRNLLQRKINERLVAFEGRTLNKLSTDVVIKITARAFIEAAFELNYDVVNRGIMSAWVSTTLPENDESDVTH